MSTRSFSALTKTKNWWPRSSIRADRVLLEHRLDREALRLDDPALAVGLGRSRRRSRGGSCFSCSGRARTRGFSRWSTARRSSLSTTSSTPARWVDRGGVGPERLAVDDERDLDDVGVGRAAMLLDGELDQGVAPIVEDPLQAGQLALRVGADVARGRRCSCP